MKELVVFSIRNLRSQGLRTYLTILGVIVGIAAIVAFMSVGKGLEMAVANEFQKIGSDKIFIVPGSPNTLGFTGGAMASEKFSDRDIRSIESVPCVENVVGYYSTSVDAEFSGEHQTLIAYGIPVDRNLELVKTMKAYDIIDGRDFRSGDHGVLVLGYKVANDIFRKKVRVRDKIYISGRPFRVIGIMGKTGGPDDYAISMPIDDARDFGFSDTYSFIIVDSKNNCDPGQTRDRVVDRLKRARGKEDFKAQTSENILSAFQSVLGIIQAIFVGVSAISLVVGGIGIMNTMLMAILERTREIGVMKAVGASNRRILMIFLAESATIGLAGGILGILFGLFISFSATGIINSVTTVEFRTVVPWSGMLLSLLFSTAVGIISGLYPAMKAARMNPVDALRWE